MNDKSNNLLKSFESFINEGEKPDNQLSNLDLSSINNIEIHYLCTKCLKFPFIKFCKDKKILD